MSKYFTNFSLIRYNGARAIDITERAAIMTRIFGNNYAFYPYHVKNGMRADTVAERYYGDPDLVWLVYFSNNIVDPYHEWPMDEDTFNAHLISKYGSIDAARNIVVKYRVNWYEDTRELTRIQYNSLPPVEKKYWTPEFDNNNNPAFYRRKEIDFVAVAQDGNGNVSLSIPSNESSYWEAVSAYDIEEEENAKKSHIRLLDARFAATAVSNIKELLAV